MFDQPVLQIHRHHQWIRAATLEKAGDGCVRLHYLPDYVFSADPVPVALDLPVAFAPPATWMDDLETPSFLPGLVPPGRGRRALAHVLGLDESDELWPLLTNGAFGAVGNLKVDTAVVFLESYVGRAPPPPGTFGGMGLEDLARFGTRAGPMTLEDLPPYALVATGTPGIAGDKPRYLFAEDDGGRLHADLVLHDDAACAHWMATAPRREFLESDRRLLRNEAAYLRVAAACGVRTHGVDRAHFVGDLLLVPRADRFVGPGGVQRLSTENVAGRAGVRRHASEPLVETIELMRRLVLRSAMRAPSEFARNPAMRTLPDGQVQLAPLADFAPMPPDAELAPAAPPGWLPGGLPGGLPRALACALRELQLAPGEAAEVAQALAAFAATVEALPDTMRDCGVDIDIIDACRPHIAEQARQLARLR